MTLRRLRQKTFPQPAGYLELKGGFINAGKYKLVLLRRKLGTADDWQVWQEADAIKDLESMQVKPGMISERTGQLVPESEPLFVLRARDNHAQAALQAYLEFCGDAKCSAEHIAGICEAIQRFMNFAQVQNAEMKQPGAPAVAAEFKG